MTARRRLVYLADVVGRRVRTADGRVVGAGQAIGDQRLEAGLPRSQPHRVRQHSQH